MGACVPTLSGMTSIKEDYGNSPWYLPLEDTVASVSVLGKVVFLRENTPALAYRALPASKHGFGQKPIFPTWVSYSVPSTPGLTPRFPPVCRAVFK